MRVPGVGDLIGGLGEGVRQMSGLVHVRGAFFLVLVQAFFEATM